MYLRIFTSPCILSYPSLHSVHLISLSSSTPSSSFSPPFSLSVPISLPFFSPFLLPFLSHFSPPFPPLFSLLSLSFLSPFSLLSLPFLSPFSPPTLPLLSPFSAPSYPSICSSFFSIPLIVPLPLPSLGREYQQLDILLFHEVLDHIARIDRVLTSPGGSLLLDQWEEWRGQTHGCVSGCPHAPDGDHHSPCLTQLSLETVQE